TRAAWRSTRMSTTEPPCRCRTIPYSQLFPIPYSLPSTHHDRPVEQLVVLPPCPLHREVFGLCTALGVGGAGYQAVFAVGEGRDLQAEEGPGVRVAGRFEGSGRPAAVVDAHLHAVERGSIAPGDA